MRRCDVGVASVCRDSLAIAPSAPVISPDRLLLRSCSLARLLISLPFIAVSSGLYAIVYSPTSALSRPSLGIEPNASRSWSYFSFGGFRSRAALCIQPSASLEGVTVFQVSCRLREIFCLNFPSYHLESDGTLLPSHVPSPLVNAQCCDACFRCARLPSPISDPKLAMVKPIGFVALLMPSLGANLKLALPRQFKDQ